MSPTDQEGNGMKEYQKPILEIISFASEAITDEILDPEVSVGSGNPEWED